MPESSSSRNIINGNNNGSNNNNTSITNHPARNNSTSQESHGSLTAEEFITSQLQLEADAREALPYQFDICTRPLGPLRQSIFSCLTCNPPPFSSSAGICYACSISCHGEHSLVELFTRRDFVCDCGTTRIKHGATAAQETAPLEASTTPCALQINSSTNAKGNVRDQSPAPGNKYNKNFQNRFCGCDEEYDAHQEKGTMFQCMGLASEEEGGCGEDWWHPECILGIGRDWYEQERKMDKRGANGEVNASVDTKENTGADAKANADADIDEDNDRPLPPGFPAEDDFDSFICYKCVNVYPWLKRYAGTDGFLPGVVRNVKEGKTDDDNNKKADPVIEDGSGNAYTVGTVNANDRSEIGDRSASGNGNGKRKASSLNDGDDDGDNHNNSGAENHGKRLKHHSEAKAKAEAQFELDAKPEPNTKSQSNPGSGPGTSDTESTFVNPTTTTKNITDKTEPNPDPACKTQSKPAPTPEQHNYKHCHYATLPPQSANTQLSLFLTLSFRDQFCRCPECFPRLARHRVLLEEEDVYEPPLSEDGDGSEGVGAGAGAGARTSNGNNANGFVRLRTGSVAGGAADDDRTSIRSTGTGTGSLLDRGEAALMSGMDRVKAIESITLYNDLKHKVKSFLAPYAESGEPVSADDIRVYFARLRGDADGAGGADGDAGADAGGGNGGGNGARSAGI